MERIITEAEAGLTVQMYLKTHLQFSTRLIKKVKAYYNHIQVNGNHVTVRYILEKGDRLQITFPPEKQSDSIMAEYLKLSIVYEDDWIIIIDKEAGVPSIPSQIYRTGTVANGLLYYYNKRNLPYTIHIVTRLDKDTSGLMLIAKHQYSHSLLSRLQIRGEISRSYEAFVQGRVEQSEGTIDQRIRRKKTSIIEREVHPSGQRAITHFRVLRKYEDYTHLSIQLETGRTHQIRVHFSAIDHPLLGDDLYGGETSTIKRQALHCSNLQFVHPFTHKDINFHSVLPKDMQSFIK